MRKRGALFAAATVLGAACVTSARTTPTTPERDAPPATAQSSIDSSGNCGREFGDPTKSLYTLPFPAGRTYTMFQGNCPPDPRWGHRGWLAYDFDMAIGDTVLASRGGRVSWVVQNWPDSDRRCGQENGVWISHDDGSVMAYVHFTTNGARVKVGDRVAAGTFIGLSGDSGCSSGPHLHINLLRDGSSWQKENTMLLNFRNADGPLDAKGALVQGARYRVRTP